MDFMSDQLFDGHRIRLLMLVDNGPEFISKDLDLWAYWNDVKLDSSRPGKPGDNAYIESFNAPVPHGVFERALVLELRGCQGESRGVETGLQ